MARLWNILREEVKATVDDFREKGAAAALRDAALDVREMATETGGWLVKGVKNVVSDEQYPVLQVTGVPTRGAFAPLVFPDGAVVEATVLEVEDASEPARARVAVPSTGEVMMVQIVDPNVAPPASNAVPEETDANHVDGERTLLGGLQQEWHATVQDIREKGVVGAVKDSALDAVDIVGKVGGNAVTGARSLAAPLLRSSQPASQVGGYVDSTEGVSLLDGLRQEWNYTLQDFREKGAVATVRDATLDAVDIVGDKAATALGGARRVAGSILSSEGVVSFDPFAPTAAFPASETSSSAEGVQLAPAAENVVLGPAPATMSTPAAIDGGDSDVPAAGIVAERRKSFERGNTQEEHIAAAEEVID